MLSFFSLNALFSAACCKQTRAFAMPISAKKHKCSSYLSYISTFKSEYQKPGNASFSFNIIELILIV